MTATYPRPASQPPASRSAGVFNAGPGTVTVHGDAIGEQHVTHAPPPIVPPGGEAAEPELPAADVGILTVLHQEMRAVVHVLQRHPEYQTYPLLNGCQVHEARFVAPGGAIRAVAMQTLDRGARSAVVAYREIRRRFAPPVVLLVGIAGGIGAGIDIGDVVISDQVIYYDARRESPTGVRRRGQSHAMTAALQHRLNDFFQRYGEAVPLDTRRRIRVHRGPIGSGDAVVTDAGSGIRHFLETFHEKVLAVETEAGGLAQACYEEIGSDPSLRGWLTIRGISDRADQHKKHTHHALAAQHAAVVTECLLPFLKPAGARQAGQR